MCLCNGDEGAGWTVGGDVGYGGEWVWAGEGYFGWGGEEEGRSGVGGGEIVKRRRIV